MNCIVYLVLNKHGAVSMNKKKQPALASGERCVRLLVQIPNEVFDPVGNISAEITISPEQITKPKATVKVLPPEVKL